MLVTPERSCASQSASMESICSLVAPIVLRIACPSLARFVWSSTKPEARSPRADCSDPSVCWNISAACAACAQLMTLDLRRSVSSFTARTASRRSSASTCTCLNEPASSIFILTDTVSDIICYICGCYGRFLQSIRRVLPGISGHLPPLHSGGCHFRARHYLHRQDRLR